MPDRREHRGPHPEDRRLFAPAVWPVLRAAAEVLGIRQVAFLDRVDGEVENTLPFRQEVVEESEAVVVL